MDFSFGTQDFATVGVLVFLEGVLSIDNALILAMIARDLPEHQRSKALNYGMAGAFVFRAIAIALAGFLMKWTWVKMLGGAYLIYLSIAHFFFNHGEDDGSKKQSKQRSFWKTILMIQLTDVAFAIDSILAAIALTQKYLVIILGGFIGMVLLRFAAQMFMKLLDKFPGLETTAYMLVALIGIKVVLEALHIPGLDFHSTSHPAFWIFWILMISGIVSGFFIKPKKIKLQS